MIQPSRFRKALKAGALEICAKPLLDLQVIAPEYVTAIVEQHRTLGPYYVLAPGLAMPHARPEEGKGLGLSLLKLKQGVSFGAGELTLSMSLLCSRRRTNIAISR
jgi:mannitol/fructose-specific phosphotransferase system IIA component (Ntr-type)